jgi:hypothetical protein
MRRKRHNDTGLSANGNGNQAAYADLDMADAHARFAG